MKKAIISTVTRGKYVGQFTFSLCIQNGSNRTTIAEGIKSEETKDEVINTLSCCFPEYEIEDESKDVQAFDLVD
jgi:hypothetical protein